MQALIFDLDGTLIDTVYAHVFAWQRAFAESGLAIDGWRIHRRIGMSGGLAARAAARLSPDRPRQARRLATVCPEGGTMRSWSWIGRYALVLVAAALLGAA
ncbi:MAG: HAD hydrolase-like protein, partial [Gammaproteobacteria bacterium]|nr:HAD hydrolase-like protein [Gammaproteobacteria bacterium]